MNGRPDQTETCSFVFSLTVVAGGLCCLGWWLWQRDHWGWNALGILLGLMVAASLKENWPRLRQAVQHAKRYR